MNHHEPSFEDGSQAAPEDSPAALGYRWPAEWAPHRATWLVWPHNADTWPGKFDRIPAVYAEFVRAVAGFEPVELIVSDSESASAATEAWGGQTSYPIHCHVIPTNDSWIRDFGPTFLRGPHGQIAGIDWRYNAWGGKYPPFDLDQQVAQVILARGDQRRFVGPLTMEGGAIDGNGAGWVMTTRSSLLDARRNLGARVQDIEAVFANMLNAHEVIWLPGEGLAGDDTDGHIDQLARFVSDRQVVVAVAADDHDPNARPLAANLRLLKQWRSSQGESLEVISLPTPRRRWCQGRRLPCSYCNFIFVNGGVIVPQFDDPADEYAVSVLEGLLPGHQIVPVPALDLVWGLGAFHCLSQQEPSG